jgi:hypothetical protein
MSIKNLVMRPNLQPKIYKSPVVAHQLYHMYATTRYNFVHHKAKKKKNKTKHACIDISIKHKLMYT